MEIKIYADELFNTIEDLRTVLDCTGDQSITIKVREDADELMRVYVRTFSLTGNLAELKTIARDTSGSGTVSFRYCEMGNGQRVAGCGKSKGFGKASKCQRGSSAGRSRGRGRTGNQGTL